MTLTDTEKAVAARKSLEYVKDGMVVGLGEILGGVSAPAIAGRAADHYGLQAPVIMMAVCAIVGTVLALFLRETAPIRLPRRSQ